MPEETVLYTTNEIQRLFEGLAIPDGEQANEIEVSTELTVKVTFILYQSIDDETAALNSYAVVFWRQNESPSVLSTKCGYEPGRWDHYNWRSSTKSI
jgi:hypothetical protein